MISGQARALLEFAGAAVVIWICVRLAIRKVRRVLMASITTYVSRLQHTAFVLRLRELVFEDPFRFMSMLCSKELEWFVHRLWQEVGATCAQANIRARPDASNSAAPGHMPELHPERLPDDGMGVEKFGLRDGNALAIVKLPEPQNSGEAYLVGVVLPPDESLKEDLNRARKLVRYFTVNRWSGNRTTDFCEWTFRAGKPRELTYNVGAPRDPRGFASAIETKLHETRKQTAPHRAAAAHS